MPRAYGMPGVGGSLGKCCYCGGTFLKEILLGTTCRCIVLGGQDMFIHTQKENSCFDKLVALTEDGQLSVDVWHKLPENSPLRAAMKASHEAQTA